MDVIAEIRKRAKARIKKIALPEYKDKRVIEAVKIIEREKIAQPVFLSPDTVDKRENERYAEEYYNSRKSKGITPEDARKTFEDPLFYGAMLTRDGKVDGYVAGASHTTADVCRAALYCIGVDERLMTACSSFIMAMPENPAVPEGALIYADCGLIPDPTPRQLACIAISAAELGKKVLDAAPRVALLSYSTKGSAKGKMIDRVTEALKILKEMAPDILADGELQSDAALIPEVAKIKCPDSPVAGRANILIFPNLEAGNICYKLTERLAGARALGPLLMGFKRPCSDLSRGCSVEDVVDCTAVTSIRA
ncbi:MAG: phosphate acetyltransferase [Candidatus Omnitrophica bacterium]|jgi:phosphate acetyltransferase|nr:phosphate acetyltransferase [Candidatus Omnitrophota bacterium]